MNTAERIKKLLKDAGVPERKVRRTLADLCGISYQAVKEWFDGSTRRISPEYLVLIADEYGSSVEYLISGAGAPYRDGETPTPKNQVDQEAAVKYLPILVISLIFPFMPLLTAAFFGK